MRRPLAFVAAAALAVTLAACDEGFSAATPNDAPSANPNSGVVRVAAAFSLTDALTAAKGSFETANPGSRLVVTFGPSQAFVGQVQAGGFDAFASEDLAGAQAVVTGRHAAGPAQAFATDRIVLVVPSANSAGISAPTDLAKSGVRVASTAADTPLATATTALLSAFESNAGAPAGFAKAAVANMTSVGNDPRAVVAAVAESKADAAFAYASDVQGKSGVTVLPMSTAVSGKAFTRLAVVVIAEAGDPVAASAFARWLTTSGGLAALAPFGFDPPGTR